MKLRDKLKLSFFIMIILPLILCVFAIGIIFRYQSTSIKRLYGVDEAVKLENMYSSATIMSEMTDKIYESIKQVAVETPEKYTDMEYLHELDIQLAARLSNLVVARNNDIIYASESLESDEIKELIPEYTSLDSAFNESIYKGGDYHCIVKQINFREQNGDIIGVYIITSLNQIIPQIKWLALQALAAVLVILILTSLVLDLWLYSSIVKPLDKLRLAAQNIKLGNLDFEMPKVSRDEIGDVCRDFEEMRVILKETSEEKLNSDKEEKTQDTNNETNS